MNRVNAHRCGKQTHVDERVPSNRVHARVKGTETKRNEQDDDDDDSDDVVKHSNDDDDASDAPNDANASDDDATDAPNDDVVVAKTRGEVGRCKLGTKDEGVYFGTVVGVVPRRHGRGRRSGVGSLFIRG